MTKTTQQQQQQKQKQNTTTTKFKFSSSSANTPPLLLYSQQQYNKISQYFLFIIYNIILLNNKYINNIIIILLLLQQNKQGDETQSRHPRLAHILILGKQAPTPRNRGTGSGQRLVHGQGNKCGPFRLGSGFGALRLCIRCLSPLLLSVDSKHHWRGPRFGSTFLRHSFNSLSACMHWLVF